MRTQTDGAPLRVAILLSAEHFESFFVDQLGLTHDDYVEHYRNDWAWDYCAILRERGIDATIYVPSLERDGLQRAGDGYGVRFLRLGRTYRPWTRFPVLKRSPPGRWLAQLAATASLEDRLEAAVAADGIDVLVVQEYWHGRFDLLALRSRTPVVAVDQGLPDRREIKLLKRRAMRRAAAVITQTRYEAAKVTAWGGTAAHIPNAVDVDFFRPPEGGGTRERWTAMTLARLHDPQKRISDLLRALARTDPRWVLDVYGNGPDEAMLRGLAAELGLDGRVRFRGFVDDKTVVRDRLQRCSAFVLPSAWEGLPVALLEAMACGAPSVGTDIPAIAEVLEQGGGAVVPVGAPERLAAGIEAAGEHAAQWSAAARATIVDGYSRPRLGAELESLLTRVARTKAASSSSASRS